MLAALKEHSFLLTDYYQVGHIAREIYPGAQPGYKKAVQIGRRLDNIISPGNKKISLVLTCPYRAGQAKSSINTERKTI